MKKSHFVAKNMFHKMNSNFERTESVYTQTDSNFDLMKWMWEVERS